ncbi:Endonuclease/exonuclease/phosphatase superfamily [Sesbania bispinosa]|nr:Endonuclease/exonuclease/phosphatase superfamily [Sesbania bispinosa]
MGVNLLLFTFSDNLEAQEIIHRGPWPQQGTRLVRTKSLWDRVVVQGMMNHKLMTHIRRPWLKHQQPLSTLSYKVRKCRKFIAKNHSREKKKEDLGYFVELPEDDDEDYQITQYSTIQQETKSQLIVGWNSSLPLKRYREDAFVDATHLFEDLWSKEKRKKMLENGDISELLISQETDSFSGQFGGLCLLWKRPWDVHIKQFCLNFIHASISNLNDLSNWECTFVYGNPIFRERRHLWNRLSALHIDQAVPWCCLGDFNEILFQHEKVGLQTHPNNRMDLFREFLNSNGLMDLDLKGCQFTWHSNPRNGFVTKEKIDRILVNWPWRNIYENAMALALPVVSSDHTPILFWPHPPLTSGTSFKYEAMWEEHEECEAIVRQGWNLTETSQNASENFLKKAKNCEDHLMVWHRRTFKHLDTQVSIMKKDISSLLNEEDGNCDWGKVQKLKADIDKIRRQQEIYWGQRSRVKWMKFGERNTSFFHGSTIQRRDWNRLHRIIDDNGNWVEVSNAIFNHFSPVFKSSNPQSFQNVLQNIPFKVNDDMDRNFPSSLLSFTNPSFFADDVILFSKANQQEIYHFSHILNSFSSAFGQTINASKSGVIFGRGVSPTDKASITSILGIQEWASPGKYLGLPGEWSRSKSNSLAWLKEKVARLWWASSGRFRGIHWKSWDFISASKKDGGLGFKDFHLMNSSLLAKQVWRAYKNPGSLLVKVLKEIYFPNTDILHASRKRGLNVDIQGDIWLFLGDQIKLRDPCPYSKVGELLNPAFGNWDQQLITRFITPDHVDKVFQTPTGGIGLPDIFIWPHHVSGEYQVKADYHVLKTLKERPNPNLPSSSVGYEL